MCPASTRLTWDWLAPIASAIWICVMPRDRALFAMNKASADMFLLDIMHIIIHKRILCAIDKSTQNNGIGIAMALLTGSSGIYGAGMEGG